MGDIKDEYSIFSKGAPVMDLGHGVRAQFTTITGHEGEHCGLMEEHPRPDGKGMCHGAIDFKPYGKPGRPSWEVVSMDPLTLSPSLLCRACGHHGYIRNGKWEPA